MSTARVDTIVRGGQIVSASGISEHGHRHPR